MPETLFVADLHLDRERPQIIDLFTRFTDDRASRADALYILGDLFEYWIGDDDPAEGLESVLVALKALGDRGVQVYFMHGNRDFLIGKQFADRTGCRLLDGSKVIDLYGENTLIMHGDTLCTDDTAYQSFRATIRNKWVLKLLLSLNLKTRKRMAAYLRSKSQELTGKKPVEIMDVNQQAVEQAMLDHNAFRLIHGHTHRPGIHRFKLGNRPATRIVLGDWYEQGNVLRCDAQGCQFMSLP